MNILIVDRHIVDKDQYRGFTVDLVVISRGAYEKTLYWEKITNQNLFLETCREVFMPAVSWFSHLNEGPQIIVVDDYHLYPNEYVTAKVISDCTFNYKTGKLEKCQ